jgi:predicted MFS family arabinose efflux permease
LPFVILSQFATTSLWFAGNAVLPDLQAAGVLPASAIGTLTSAVQLGFIAGTLVFAFFSLVDRVAPRKLFLGFSLIGAACNAALLMAGSYEAMIVLRTMTGVCLAGIYPIGLKIAASWYERGLGRAIGLLIGALVLGAALPYLIRALGGELPWQEVLLAVSVIAVAGGLLMALGVREGPYLSGRVAFDPRQMIAIFRNPEFRTSTFGYFGHMWELYAFWAFAPIWLMAHPAAGTIDIALWSFIIIAAGAVGSALGGYASLYYGSARVATWQLAASMVLCLTSPLLFRADLPFLLAGLVVWGMVVVGDSAQFSTLNARYAPRAYVGTSLTLVTSIGYLITIPSLQLLDLARQVLAPQWWFLLLAPGPLLGTLAMLRLIRVEARQIASS